MSDIYEQCKVRVGSCARTLLDDVHTLRSKEECVADAIEAERLYTAFELVQKAFDVLTGGKRPGMRGT